MDVAAYWCHNSPLSSGYLPLYIGDTCPQLLGLDMRFSKYSIIHAPLARYSPAGKISLGRVSYWSHAPAEEFPSCAFATLSLVDIVSHRKAPENSRLSFGTSKSKNILSTVTPLCHMPKGSTLSTVVSTVSEKLSSIANMGASSVDAEEKQFQAQVKAVEEWWKDSRWRFTKRPYTAAQIVQKRGSLMPQYANNEMSKKLWKTVEQRFEVCIDILVACA